MSTTLWDKFQSSVRYIVGTTKSGVASYRVADSSLPAVSAGSSVTSPEGPPAGLVGVNIEGLATVNALIEFDDINQSATLLLYYYKSNTWFAGETIEVETPVDGANLTLPPIDTEGFNRIFIRVMALSGDLVTRSIFPHSQ